MVDHGLLGTQAVHMGGESGCKACVPAFPNHFLCTLIFVLGCWVSVNFHLSVVSPLGGGTVYTALSVS
jgi:hypothetical protein